MCACKRPGSYQVGSEHLIILERPQVEDGRTQVVLDQVVRVDGGEPLTTSQQECADQGEGEFERPTGQKGKQVLAVRVLDELGKPATDSTANVARNMRIAIALRARARAAMRVSADGRALGFVSVCSNVAIIVGNGTSSGGRRVCEQADRRERWGNKPIQHHCQHQ